MDTDNVFNTNIGANGGNGDGDGDINGDGNWVRFGQAKNSNDDSEDEEYARLVEEGRAGLCLRPVLSSIYPPRSISTCCLDQGAG